MNASDVVRVAVFPGAANAPLYRAVEAGLFADAGLQVPVTHVVSSDEQMRLWADGSVDAMQTSPDHLLRERRPRDPVIVRRDGFGELSVHKLSDAGEAREVEWAVDGLDSGFAFVLRAILEDRCGVPTAEQRLVPVGGTKQRFEAMLDPGMSVAGTTLHPPFDVLAADRGCVRLGGHLEFFPELATLVTVVPRASAGTPAIAAFADVLDRAVADLVAGGAAAVEEVLVRNGLPGPVASAAAAGMLGPGGLAVDRAPSLRGLEVAAELRGRFAPDWAPPVPLAELVV